MAKRTQRRRIQRKRTQKRRTQRRRTNKRMRAGAFFNPDINMDTTRVTSINRNNRNNFAENTEMNNTLTGQFDFPTAPLPVPVPVMLPRGPGQAPAIRVPTPRPLTPIDAALRNTPTGLRTSPPQLRRSRSGMLESATALEALMAYQTPNQSPRSIASGPITPGPNI
jgi:hypothetical protein